MPLRLRISSVVIASVFSVAAALSFTVPSVSHFVVSCFPIIYDKTVFLLKPPYLYIVINCIIVSIVATSKLTYKLSSGNDSEFSDPFPVSSVTDTGYFNMVQAAASDYTGVAEKNDVRDDDDDDDDAPEVVPKLPEVIANDDKRTLDDGEDPHTDKPAPELEKTKPTNDSTEISIPKKTRKPPRSSPQGGNKKTALGVTKPPRRQDTLEATWKKITEGRSTPLKKHLKKSDTWQERSHVQNSSEQKKMTKSENLNATMNETRLKREPSPGQEELNRRVEAFIKKFNEEMRLQRLESLAKYNEMVNGGTRL